MRELWASYIWLYVFENKNVSTTQKFIIIIIPLLSLSASIPPSQQHPFITVVFTRIMILSRGVFFLSLQENLEFLAPFDCYFKKKKKYHDFWFSNSLVLDYTSLKISTHFLFK